jgi:hypothetical protein
LVPLSTRDAIGEAEPPQDVFGGGMPTGTRLGVRRQLLDLGGSACLAQLALDERLDLQRDQ